MLHTPCRCAREKRLAVILVFERIRVRHDGFAVRIEQRSQSACVSRHMEIVIHARLAVDQSLVNVGNALAICSNKAIVLFHRRLRLIPLMPVFYHIQVRSRQSTKGFGSRSPAR